MITITELGANHQMLTREATPGEIVAFEHVFRPGTDCTWCGKPAHGYCD